MERYSAETKSNAFNTQKLELARKDILECMEAVEQNCGDTLWMNFDSPVHETVFERLWQLYLTLGGNEEELKNIFL